MARWHARKKGERKRGAPVGGLKRKLHLVLPERLQLMSSGHFVDEFLKLTGVLEVPVYGGEAHICDAIDRAEPLHDQGAELHAGNFQTCLP